MNAEALTPGRVITHNQNVEYDFKSPNVGAGEADIDGRRMLLNGATYFQLAEYVYSADASNANFASTQVAQSPFVMAMKTMQCIFYEDFARLIAWVNPDWNDVMFVGPELVYRDPDKRTESNEKLWQSRIMSTQTWQEKEGLDPKVEAERLAPEAGPGL